MSYKKDEGEHKGGVPWLTFPKSTSIASRCVTNLKHSLDAEVPEQVNWPFSRNTGGVLRSAVCAVPWDWKLPKNCLSDCHSSMGPRNASPPWPP